MKKIKVLVIFIIVSFGLIGCSNNLDKASKVSESAEVDDSKQAEMEEKQEEKQEETNLYGEKTMSEIEKELSTIISDDSEKRFDEVIPIGLLKRNTKEETDDVFYSVELRNDSYSVKRDYHLEYNHYTTGGWILDNYSIDKEYDLQPISGPSRYEIESALGNMIYGNAEYEVITTDDDFENYMSTVYVELKANGAVCSIDGCLNLNFDYIEDGDFWEFKGYTPAMENISEWNFTGTYVCDKGSFSHNGLMLHNLEVKELRQQDGVWYDNYWHLSVYENGVINDCTLDSNGYYNDKVLYEDFANKRFLTSNEIEFACFNADQLYWSPAGQVLYYDKISNSILSPEQVASVWASGGENFADSSSEISSSDTSIGGLCEFSSTSLIDDQTMEQFVTTYYRSDGSAFPGNRSISKMVINDIYAKHGYQFKDEELMAFFNKYDWYNPVTSDINTIEFELNQYEKENIKYLQNNEW